MNLLLVILPPDTHTMAGRKLWLSFVADANNYAKKDGAVRALSESSYLLTYEKSAQTGTAILQNATEAGLRYELYVCQEASKEIRDQLDPFSR